MLTARISISAFLTQKRQWLLLMSWPWESVGAEQTVNRDVITADGHGRVFSGSGKNSLLNQYVSGLDNTGERARLSVNMFVHHNGSLLWCR